MDEYVEKAAFREHLDSVPPFTKYGQRDPEYDFAKTVFLSELAAYPAADVAPVRHGRWIQKEKCYPEIEKQMDFRFECSECGFSDIHNATLDVPYCWHCGAKMDKEEDNG